MCRLGKVAKQTEAQNYSEVYSVNVADRWKERKIAFLPGEISRTYGNDCMKYG
ncbi:MAG TPA: hypothetical protein VFC41_07530 [Anaerovoracaceae bacterium]|nr:hypothetical protein [Anaerovoracaceae bacterium]